ncbi:Secretory phospholipase A2 receptor [Oryzias melastigma]|uniref:Secretory phospholipase A2 receptor n=2 Tax=Oryzias melastigma TaxID=30732 RepID=A0A834BWZ6_ORYME|nr:macrophage mannose receptor 1 [Oryzias melastigma]KAF6716190.1 Secretory phospholipase A2 receptor [Oryzias melastigma]
MEKKSSPGLILCYFLASVLHLEAKLEVIVYLQKTGQSWDDARQDCQQNHVDMATWNTVNLDDVAEWLEENDYSAVWIGLHQDSQDFGWRWINVRTGVGLTGDDVTQSENWSNTLDVGELLLGKCGALLSNSKKWDNKVCSSDLPYICFDDNLLLITENKTWEDALNHCRSLSTSSLKYDLLSLSTLQSQGYIRDRIYKATTDQVWVGLRFLGDNWFWSDGSTVSEQDMLSKCPAQWKFCGAVSKNGTDEWMTRDCSERRNFICASTEVEN